jgi:hypothetical protein
MRLLPRFPSRWLPGRPRAGFRILASAGCLTAVGLAGCTVVHAPAPHHRSAKQQAVAAADNDVVTEGQRPGRPFSVVS